jgi:hypothetical protein
MAEKEYYRLTYPRARSSMAVAFVGHSSLWLGKDHLLCVEAGLYYVETYKRFYFRDIQALIIVDSKRRVIWNWVLGSIAAIFLLGWIAVLWGSSSNDFWRGVIIGAIVTSIPALPLLINNLLGPTVTCYLRTAVQTEELASLKRLRRAHTVFARLRPLIVQAQGQLNPEGIPARMSALIESAQSPAATTYPVAGTVPQPAAQPAPQPERYVIDDLNAPPRIIP